MSVALGLVVVLFPVPVLWWSLFGLVILGVNADDLFPGSFTCDASTDDCGFKYDGECDSGLFGCAIGTDW